MVTPNRSHKILVVDDEEDLRAVIKDEFELSGWTVYQAESGNKALANFKEHPVEAIVSDIRMQDGNGIELLKKIKSMAGHSPLVFLITGYSDFTTDEVFNLGADGIFNKPFDLDDIITTVNNHLEGRRSLWSQPLAEKPRAAAEMNIEPLTQYLGNGGIFVPCQQNLHRMGDLINFRFHCTTGELSEVSGQGVVRWTRAGGDEPGFGLEFLHLDNRSLNEVCSYIEKHKPVQYIPNKKL